MVREAFQEQLAALQDKLLAMSALVDRAIERSVRALADGDQALAQEVIDDDLLINSAQRELEEQCLELIATQQPKANDLRFIMSTAALAAELERMGDHCKGIAIIAQRLAGSPPLKPLIDIPRMAGKGRELLRGQLNAFIHHDAEKARALAQEDDVVDSLYDQVYRELLVFMMEDPRTITRATYLLWAAHNLERIGDRTTNIAERVSYLATGEVEELNPQKSGR
jgi:phosphate transport system protein